MVQAREVIRDRLQFARMDAVAGLLDGPRARGAFLLRSSMDPPWSLRIEDEAPLTLVAMVRGERVAARRRATIRIGPGRRRRHPRARTPTPCADDPETAPQVVIRPGERCATPEGPEAKPMGGPRRAHVGQRAPTARR